MDSHSSVPYSSADSSPTINSSSVETSEDHAIDESNTLFLGDLPPSATAQQISDLFPDFEVSHVEIKIINSAKGSLCYAFVTFATAESAQLGIDKYDGNQALFPDGTVVRVGWAKRNSRLHVSNLDENTTEKDLVELFTRYGDLSPQDGVLIIKKPSSNPQIQNQIVCYGVIHYEQRESAETAKNNLNNTYFGGRRLRVEWNRASRKSLITRFPLDDVIPSEPLLHYSSMSPVISIYVQFETLDSDSRVNEALISEIFEPFGNMTGCFIKTNNTSVSGLRQHGYAFVHFDNSYEGKKSALAAASISKDCPYQHEGVLFHAEVSKNFKKATSYTQSYGGFRNNFNHYNDDEFGEEEIFGEYPRMAGREKPEIFLNSGPPTGQLADSGTYFYPHPSAQQYMIPYNPNMMYQSVPYQNPYNNSYSPVSANSDFVDNQMVYYAAHQPYNYPQISMRTFPHNNTDPSAVPSALQSQGVYRNGPVSVVPGTPSDPPGGPLRFYPLAPGYPNQTPRPHSTPSPSAPHSAKNSIKVLTPQLSHMSPQTALQQQQQQLQQQAQYHMPPQQRAFTASGSW